MSDVDSTGTDSAAILVEYLADVSLRTAERLGGTPGWDGMVSVAITLAVATEPTTVGASSELARQVDQMQYAHGAGPCLHALSTGEGLYVPDLANEGRWGDYGPRAASMGVACCLSAPVRVAGSVAAVLKVYSAAIDGLDAAQQEVARLAAVEISGGIALARRLQAQDTALADRIAAMDNRHVIDLALGMIMARQGCGPDDAFVTLRGYSQQRNVKLREVAQRLVAQVNGEGIPEAPFRNR